MSPSDVSMRVVADHLRATTFLIADGVIPSNEWRGYVLRKIMRRAMRHGKHLGFTEPFLHGLVGVLDREMGDAYPELRRNRETIEKTILAEEDRFDAVLTDGLPRLEAELAKVLGHRSRSRCRATRRSSCTTRSASRTTSSRTRRRPRASPSTRRRSTRRWKASATRRAPAAPSAAKKGEEFAIGGEAVSAALAGVGDALRGLHDDPRQRRAGAGAVRRAAAAGGRAQRRIRAATSRSRRRRSTSKPAVRCRTPAASSTRRPARRRRSRGWRASGTGLPRAHRVRVTSGELRVRDIVTAEVDADGPRRDAPQSHRDAPAPRGAARGARQPRQAGGLAGRARSPALRLRALSGRSPATSSIASSGSSTSRSAATRR